MDIFKTASQFSYCILILFISEKACEPKVSNLLADYLHFTLPSLKP